MRLVTVLGVGSTGVEGTLIPYTFANDSELLVLFLVVALTAIVCIVRSWSFVVRQARSFFFVPRRISEATDTSSELRYQYVLTGAAALSIGTGYSLYHHLLSDYSRFFLSHLACIGILSAVVFVFLWMRILVYLFVNWIFFDKDRCERWFHVQLFITTVFMILSLPFLVMMIYFNLSLNFLQVYAISSIILTELLTIYRCFVIFFRGSAFTLQIFLYFCALELIPAGLLWTILSATTDSLILNI